MTRMNKDAGKYRRLSDKANLVRIMGDEIDTQKVGIKRIRERFKLYGPLQLPAHRSAQIKARSKLEDFLKSSGLQFLYADDQELERLYDQIAGRLTLKYIKTTIITTAERISYIRFCKATKLEIHRSCWIGNVNADFFIPAIKFSGGIGLVIEIDGTVHDLDLKGRKDTSKYEYLHSLRIALQVIENCDVVNPTQAMQKIFNQLKNYKRGCSRARKLLWRRIYIETILCHATDVELHELFRY